MASDIRFRCQHCSQKMVIDRHGAGMSIECPSCHHATVVTLPKQLNRDRASLVHWIDDAAKVAERGGDNQLMNTWRGLTRNKELVDPDEVQLILKAASWILNRSLFNDLFRSWAEAQADFEPNPALARDLFQLALALRERWGITDEMLQEWKPRTFTNS